MFLCHILDPFYLSFLGVFTYSSAPIHLLLFFKCFFFVLGIHQQPPDSLEELQLLLHHHLLQSLTNLLFVCLLLLIPLICFIVIHLRIFIPVLVHVFFFNISSSQSHLFLANHFSCLVVLVICLGLPKLGSALILLVPVLCTMVTLALKSYTIILSPNISMITWGP